MKSWTKNTIGLWFSEIKILFPFCSNLSLPQKTIPGLLFPVPFHTYTHTLKADLLAKSTAQFTIIIIIIILSFRE